MDKDKVPFKGIQENEAIRAILEGTSTETGRDFFISLVKNLSKVLNTHGAMVTEYLEEEGRLRSIACVVGNQRLKEFEYAVPWSKTSPKC